MQGPSIEFRIAKTRSNGSVELWRITMTADFRKRLRRSVTLSVNRGEIKIIRQQAWGVFLIAQARVAQAWSNRGLRFWFPRLMRSVRNAFCDNCISQASRTLVSFMSETVGIVIWLPISVLLAPRTSVSSCNRDRHLDSELARGSNPQDMLVATARCDSRLRILSTLRVAAPIAVA